VNGSELTLDRVHSAYLIEATGATGAGLIAPDERVATGQVCEQKARWQVEQAGTKQKA
jgi:hypothetical protein